MLWLDEVFNYLSNPCGIYVVTSRQYNWHCDTGCHTAKCAESKIVSSFNITDITTTLNINTSCRLSMVNLLSVCLKSRLENAIGFAMYFS